MKYPSTECHLCNKAITNNNITKHLASCKGPKVRVGKSDAWYAAMASKTSRNQYTKAADLGLPRPKFQPNSQFTFKGREHSTETRDKMRSSRIKFLEENPDKVPYKLNHYSKGRSYPEQYWMNILYKHDISFVEQYQIGLYSLDFAIIDKKIDLEIDGEQHYLDQRIVESDIRRTALLNALGWNVIRIRWSTYQKLVDKEPFVHYILSQL
jgi:very-short-patch-repair endonuclease